MTASLNWHKLSVLNGVHGEDTDNTSPISPRGILSPVSVQRINGGCSSSPRALHRFFLRNRAADCRIVHHKLETCQQNTGTAPEASDEIIVALE